MPSLFFIPNTLGGTTPNLNQVLTAGNTTSGADMVVSVGDDLLFGSDLRLSRTAIKTLTLDDNAGGAVTFITQNGASDTFSASPSGVRVGAPGPGFSGTPSPSDLEIYKFSSSPTNSPIIRPLRARGTSSVPTPVLSGDTLLSINPVGYNSTGFGNTSATIKFFAAEDFTGITVGGIITFNTCPIGGFTSTERMRISDSGFVGVAVTAPVGTEKFGVTGDAYVSGVLQAAKHATTSTSVFWSSGTGTPEGAVTASVGSLYTNTTGGAGTTLYVKESGVGNTGWIAK